MHPRGCVPNIIRSSDKVYAMNVDVDTNDAAERLGRALARHRNVDPLGLVLVFYLHEAQAVEPGRTDRQQTLDLLDFAAQWQKALAAQIEQIVLSARDMGASWADIGASVGIGKQTAYSRWGKAIESRDGNYFINDVARDMELPLVRVTPSTPLTEAQANPIAPTAAQRRRVAGWIKGDPDTEWTDLDLIANAVVTLARSMAATAQRDWNDEAEAEHYLTLALAVMAPAAPGAEVAGGTN